MEATNLTVKGTVPNVFCGTAGQASVQFWASTGFSAAWLSPLPLPLLVHIVGSAQAEAPLGPGLLRCSRSLGAGVSVPSET